MVVLGGGAVSYELGTPVSTLNVCVVAGNDVASLGRIHESALEVRFDAPAGCVILGFEL